MIKCSHRKHLNIIPFDKQVMWHRQPPLKNVSVPTPNVQRPIITTRNLHRGAKRSHCEELGHYHCAANRPTTPKVLADIEPLLCIEKARGPFLDCSYKSQNTLSPNFRLILHALSSVFPAGPLGRPISAVDIRLRQQTSKRHYTLFPTRCSAWRSMEAGNE